MFLAAERGDSLAPCPQQSDAEEPSARQSGQAAQELLPSWLPSARGAHGPPCLCIPSPASCLGSGFWLLGLACCLT